MSDHVEVSSQWLTRLRGIPRHRIGMGVVFAALLVTLAVTMRWDWLPKYAPMIAQGICTTVWLLAVSVVLGMLLAIPIGLAQVVGPWPLAKLAAAYCTVIRGTPLLIQIFFLYYGLGSLFPHIPEIRGSWMWPYLREAWPYALLALTMSFAGYEGEIMRGAFAGVPRGELEAARAYGMPRFKILRRIWLPRAVQRVLPTLAGEVVLQLKSTPLVATITVFDAYGVISRIRSDTYITYEPLLLLALIYIVLAAGIVGVFGHFEKKTRRRRV
ncbi:ABC transporter permease [Shimia sp. R11_0]|uniref:ABC transporter permease n=1 Tax=Shimia sp. R11_0 TaxID=2821096 RepID=UPI001AD9E390|nr:ABC transporter permease [Shimia sp. R11_0]MBO9479711.1 ABC transporter permease [Shimia sp. R11_0]